MDALTDEFSMWPVGGTIKDDGAVNWAALAYAAMMTDVRDTMDRSVDPE